MTATPATDMTARPDPPWRIPEIDIPTEWEALIASWPATAPGSSAIDLIRRAKAAGLLARLHDTNDDGFGRVLRDALDCAAHGVTVRYPPWCRAVPVVSLLGLSLGKVDYQPSPLLGGPASAVPTGGIDRYEQAWHTDSTPWATPNRWSILGMLREDPALRDAPTALLPWHLLEPAWKDDAAVSAALRWHQFSWRDQYTALPKLMAPIRGDVPRWFRPALAHLIDGPADPIDACSAVDEALRRATTWYEAVVTPQQVLVFDNHAVLHRGPAVKDLSARTLLRLKVDGVPER